MKPLDLTGNDCALVLSENGDIRLVVPETESTHKANSLICFGWLVSRVEKHGLDAFSTVCARDLTGVRIQ